MRVRSKAWLAWSLVDNVAPLLDARRHAWLCAAIGAGDTEAAIFAILDVYVRCASSLPTHLVHYVESWGAGYEGTDLAGRVDFVFDQLIPARREATL